MDKLKDNESKTELVYPELSYEIIGVLYDVFNQLGYGYKEIYYQRATANCFTIKKILFKEQMPAQIKFKGKIIGKIYLDFLVESKIILELKKADRFSRKEIEQVVGYLMATKLKLAILAHFTKDGVKYKRILNLH